MKFLNNGLGHDSQSLESLVVESQNIDHATIHRYIMMVVIHLCKQVTLLALMPT